MLEHRLEWLPKATNALYTVQYHSLAWKCYINVTECIEIKTTKCDLTKTLKFVSALYMIRVISDTYNNSWIKSIEFSPELESKF